MGAPVASGTLGGSPSVSWATIHNQAARGDFSRFRRHPSGCTTRTTLSDRRGVRHRRQARLPQPREAAARDRHQRRCEIRPSGRRDAASPRLSVSSRRLYAAHNSRIAGGHGHAVRRDYRNRGEPRVPCRAGGRLLSRLHQRGVATPDCCPHAPPATRDMCAAPIAPTRSSARRWASTRSLGRG